MASGSRGPHTGAHMSVEAYFALDEQGFEERFEFENGVIYRMDGVTVAHSCITHNVRCALSNRLSQTTCSVSGPILRTQIQLGACYYYPDVVVSCTKTDHIPTNTLICYPHLVVEVLSAESAARDSEKKLLAYQQCPSVQEIVLVEEFRRFVEVHVRQAQADMWRRIGFWGDEIVRLESLGLNIKMEEIYQGIDFSEEMSI